MKRIGFLSFVLFATLIAGCSSGKGKDLGQAKSTEPATVGTSGAADTASQDAKDFIHHVAIVNMAEIDLGKLAADRGTAEEVKKFAQMMIEDHTAAGDKLKALASDLKMEAPGQLDDKHTDQRDKLSKRSGDGLRSRVCERDGRRPQGPDRPARAADRQEDTRAVESRDERQDDGGGRDRRHSSGPRATIRRRCGSISSRPKSTRPCTRTWKPPRRSRASLKKRSTTP